MGEFWVAPAIAAFFIAPLPLWIALVRTHERTSDVLTSGWTPIVSAMAIGNISGMFLERSVSLYRSLALLVPVRVSQRHIPTSMPPRLPTTSNAQCPPPPR